MNRPSPWSSPGPQKTSAEHNQNITRPVPADASQADPFDLETAQARLKEASAASQAMREKDLEVYAEIQTILGSKVIQKLPRVGRQPGQPMQRPATSRPYADEASRGGGERPRRPPVSE